VIKEAEERRKLYNRKTILFIDELHRFNKSQQDALLPYVENGTVVLIGATTENPYYEVNSPLLSRSRVFALKPLDQEDLERLIQRALTDKERGLGEMNPALEAGALSYLIQMANGDARTALNALEAAVAVTEPDAAGRRMVDRAMIADVLQQNRRNYDRAGDEHYQTISAFIKSMRGSDPDGALYWLARMLAAGEDIKFIARRIIICAAEDVGNADPQALVVSTAAAQAVQFVGLPEARLILAQAAIYIATAPKSNAAYKGISAAMADLEKEGWEPVPAHLHAGNPEYLYPHDHPGGYVKQSYLPAKVQHKQYYCPTDRGYEEAIRQYLQRYLPQKHKSGNGQEE
jgi:putative ATPase